MMKPSPIALVLCDNIYREAGGKIALVGLFNRLLTTRFPVYHPRMSIYAAVTGARPGARFRIRLEHGETGHVVTELQTALTEEAQRTTICDFMFTLQGLHFPEPGRYYVQFWAEEHLILQRPFEVEKAVTGDAQ